MQLLHLIVSLLTADTFYDTAAVTVHHLVVKQHFHVCKKMCKIDSRPRKLKSFVQNKCENKFFVHLRTSVNLYL